MDWIPTFERERSRYEDGEARIAPEQLVRMGNAAYGAGLALLRAGRPEEAADWLDRAAARWRESWEHADPDSWGRPIGALKAELIADREPEVQELARWTLELGAATAESPIGRYAGALALLALERWPEARHVAESLRGRDDFSHDVADALATIAAGDVVGYAEAVEAVLGSFETREEYLEDVAVADTVLALQALARARGMAHDLPPSRVLPLG
jgi:tetratricopeptide (TPR) repeat protein